MKKHNMNLFLLTFSPWPVFLSLGILNLFMNIAISMNNKFSIYMYMNLMLILMLMMFWWNDIIMESSFMGFHNNYIKTMTVYSMIMFILSELFFFISFFWSFFHLMLSPDVLVGSVWPYMGINPMDYLSMPFMNSMILISSGCSVTISHYEILMNKLNKSKEMLIVTIILGLTFVMLQIVEYYISYFSFSDGAFGSIFFMSTGFHGFHVTIGFMFLSIMLMRMIKNQFSCKHLMGFEFSIWYWHFVDLVWLYLYMVVYWLGS